MKARNFLMAATAAVALGLAGGSASAATYVDPWTVSPTGGISVVFGDNGLEIMGAESIPGETTTTHAYDVNSGVFTDTFDFELPNGIVGFSLSSIGFLANSSLRLTSLTFNGQNIAFTNSAGPGDDGNVVMASSGAFPISLGGAQRLVVSGVGGREAVFSGTATFAAQTAPVPEPGAWALMILGFGGTGALLRRRQRALATA